MAARAVNLRGSPGASAARASGRTGANGADQSIVGPQLDDPGDEIEGAFVRVAFFEQRAAGIQLAELGLAGEGVQVLRLQAVERREVGQNRDVDRSFNHLEKRPAGLG